MLAGKALPYAAGIGMKGNRSQDPPKDTNVMYTPNRLVDGVA